MLDVQKRANGSRIFVTSDSNGLEGARRVLEASGAGELFRPGMRVALKPNLVVAKPASSGATTSPQVVAGTIEFLKDRGVMDITVMEGAWAGGGVCVASLRLSLQ